MSSTLLNVLRVPPTRVPISVSTLASYILPPVACSFVLAVLALMPQTRATRLALWPVVALLALRAVASVDMSRGKPGQKIADAYFFSAMFDITIRTFDWASAKEPLVRHFRPANSAPSILVDALDLYTNLSGYGWNWSHGSGRVRLEAHRHSSRDRIPFVLAALFSAAVHTLVFGISHRAMLSFASAEQTARGFTLFDDALPFFLRYFRASVLATLTWIVSYTSSQTAYQLGTAVGVLFLRQDPAQWPPAFDAPWRATSLTEFWGRRWHPWCRRKLLVLGGLPLATAPLSLGRPGILLGGFLASAAVHDVFLVGLAGRTAPRGALAAFGGIMGGAVLAERAWCQWTGRRVGGFAGWVWTMAWLLVCSALMTDGWARAVAGGQDDASVLDVFVPLRMSVERAVVGFDAWLHAV